MAVAVRAGLLDGEETLLHAHLAGAAAGRAGGWARALLGAAAVTGLAGRPGWDLDAYRITVHRLLELDFEVIAQVRAAIRLWTATATAAEDVGKDVAEDIA